MTAKQTSSLATWAGIALTIGAGLGTAIYRFAVLSTKVDQMDTKLTYVVSRIDGAPPATQLPMTQTRSTPLDSLGRTASANPGHAR